MEKFKISCSVFERGIGEPNKVSTFLSKIIVAWDKLDAEWTFLDSIEDEINNAYLVETYVTKIA